MEELIEARRVHPGEQVRVGVGEEREGLSTRFVAWAWAGPVTQAVWEGAF